MAAVSKRWTLGIDGTNLREGGGLIHIVELLAAAHPEHYGFGKIIIWGGARLLDRIGDRPWLIKSPQVALDRGLLSRVLWQARALPLLAKNAGCDLLFVPGGSYFGKFHPVVTMSQNMLPFEWRELRRYGLSLKTLRLLVLRMAQSRTFKAAEGVIFLTDYVRGRITQLIGGVCTQVTTVPHGISKSFYAGPKEQQSIDCYSWEHPFRLLYVSTVDLYKHQWHVAAAIVRLRRMGLPLVLDMIGPAYPPALSRLEKLLKRVDPRGDFICYHGNRPHSDLQRYHRDSDLAVFASSCENMPIILLEAMASGLPIVCSSHAPMPEVLQDGGIYFDPENPADIGRAIRRLVNSPTLRAAKAELAFAYAQKYSWQRASDHTFSFLGEIAGKAQHV